MPYGTDTYGVEAFGSEGVAPAQTITQTVGIGTKEAFGADGRIQFSVTQGTGIPSGEVTGVGGKVDMSVAQAAGIASAEAFSAGRIMFSLTGLASIPSQEAVPNTGMAMFDIIQQAGIPSGEAFSKGEVKTNFIPGWSVRVYSLDGAVVSDVARYSGLKFQKVKSGKGSGTITLLIEDALMLDLLDRELMWRIFYDGRWAMSFLSEAVSENRIDEQQTRTVVFSGPGIAEMLEWATVLPPGYPWYGQRTWQWTDVRAMKIFRDLFNAAKDRGWGPQFVAGFSDAADTSGAAWDDSVTMEIQPGGTLYQYIDKLTGIAGADWSVGPTFSLDVYKDYGIHRENAVRFQVAGDQISFSRGRDRSGLRNVGYAEPSDGTIQEASDNGSVGVWGRREVYIQAGDAADTATAQQLASRLVDQGKEEAVQITLSVLPDGIGRKVFWDYDAGDWIGVEVEEIGLLDDYNIVSITCSVTETGTSTVELGLLSLFELQEAKLAKLQASGGSSTYAPGNLQSGTTPEGVINSVVTAPPPDAPTGLVLSTGANENRVYIDVSWTSVTQSGADPVVEYEAELSRADGGTVTAQRAVSAPVRFEPVEPGVEYTVRVRSISRMGRSSDYLGPQNVTAGVDTTIPAQATGLSIGAGVRTVTITWDENTEIDVANGNGTYDVQLDTANTFNTASLRGKRVSGTITSFTDLVQSTAYYARIRAVDASGNVGPWSATVSATTQQVGNIDIATGAVDTLKIADGAITNAKIGNAEITDAKIYTVSASKIIAGTIQAAQITIGSGGVLRSGRALSPFHYLLLDENGLRFYKNGSSQFVGGTLTLELNTSTGNAEFKGAITAASITGATISGGTITGTTITGTTITGGTVQTAASGSRVLMSGTGQGIGIYSGQAYETQPGILWGIYSNGSYLETTLQSPTRSGNSPATLALRDKGWGGTPNVELFSNWTWIGGDKFEVHWADQTLAFQASRSGSNSDIRCQFIPFLGGLTDVGIHGVSYQLGFSSSSIEFKKDVQDLSPDAEANPLWRVKPRKFHWKEDKVANAKEINARNPNGVPGFIVEELAEVDAALVTLYKDPDTGKTRPMGIDRNAMLSYIVDALQHCRARITALETELGKGQSGKR